MTKSDAAGVATPPPDSRTRLNECPALAAKARLRLDKPSGKHWILYPERGLLLEGSAADLVRACDGKRTLAEIIGNAATESGRQFDDIVDEVLAFFSDLTARGVLVWRAP